MGKDNMLKGFEEIILFSLGERSFVYSYACHDMCCMCLCVYSGTQAHRHKGFKGGYQFPVRSHLSYSFENKVLTEPQARLSGSQALVIRFQCVLTVVGIQAHVKPYLSFYVDLNLVSYTCCIKFSLTH